jgi:hypothetical protein
MTEPLGRSLGLALGGRLWKKVDALLYEKRRNSALTASRAT